ncbi:Imm31 family immunity protein [Orbaceae bacterium ESL0721]|nr:Imm31 family immunity protein [Orbaceae bacterium ESL0721]
MDRINFYAEVEILPNCEYTEFIGEKGVVMGISEEDGIIYGYAVRLYTDYENGYCFDADCLKPTGRQFKREDFYS